MRHGRIAPAKPGKRPPRRPGAGGGVDPRRRQGHRGLRDSASKHLVSARNIAYMPLTTRAGSSAALLTAAATPTAPRFPAIHVSLSTFIRFDAANGYRQIEIVEERRIPHDYELFMDFYAGLRNRIQRLAGEQNLNSRTLLAFAENVTDGAKKERYLKLARGYKDFERRSRPELVGTVSKQLWADAGIRVTVDPDVVLGVGGQRFVTKLYLAKEKLEASRVVASLQMLRECYRTPGYRVAVLDVERGALHRDTRLDERRSAIILRTTAAKFVGIWRALDEGVVPVSVPAS